MLIFDLDDAPPTRQEIQAEQERLLALRKQSFRSGLISDGLHGLVLFALYFADILPGVGFLAAVLLGTIISIILATGTSKRLASTDKLSLVLIIFGAAAAVGFVTVGYFGKELLGGILAGLATGSIIATGSILGRKIMQVLTALEALELIDEEHPAHRELSKLCRTYPKLDDYRQQARDILRPFLTFGELKAMQKWVDEEQG